MAQLLSSPYVAPLRYHTIIIGGGFFGATLAEHVGRGGGRVLLVEAGPRLLGRASMRNQARVHAGYHYPRSYLTAFRSRVNAPRFVEQYHECIYDDFAHYYAIGRAYSNVTASQFRRFCERIGAPVAAAPRHIRALFDGALIEEVVQVPEVTFDAERLRTRMERDLAAAGVEVMLDAAATHVRAVGGELAVAVRTSDDEQVLSAGQVLNCTYSRLNAIHAASGLPIVPLKHELTEMVLVRPPAELGDAAVTVMCGPYFSLVPYPSRGLHTLSHVRYTPHASWCDAPSGEDLRDGDAVLEGNARATHFPHMVRDAARYLPVMSRCEAVESIWEVKTVLPRSEVDDSRPILFSRDHGLPGFHCVIGSKIDNAYDMLEFVEESANDVSGRR